MNKRKLKLFVWEGFSPDYTDGLAVAIAPDEATARRLVVKAYCGGRYDPRHWGTLVVYPLNKRRAFAVSGGG